MSTVQFRPDYAKFLIEAKPEVWNHMYRVVCELSHERKFAGEFLKSHKTNRLWYNAEKGLETWSLEIWGEWTGIVMSLPNYWVTWLKRYDVRATVWDATKDTILDLGQHMQRTVTSHNINVYNTKPASKRLGRDRGGVGFAIGSHKSDLRITCYKRTGEPVAQEFQCTGAMLKNIITDVTAAGITDDETRSAWGAIGTRIERKGNDRLQRVLESCGIGTYWPVIGAHDIPRLPPIQAAIIAEIDDILADDDLFGERLEP
jgi:hypothetical protein